MTPGEFALRHANGETYAALLEEVVDEAYKNGYEDCSEDETGRRSWVNE